jgi:hypothetical protein
LSKWPLVTRLLGLGVPAGSVFNLLLA